MHFSCCSAAWQLGTSCPAPICCTGPGASIVCAGCASDFSSSSGVELALACCCCCWCCCPFMRCVHCCCVLLLLIFLSALLFIATEKCLPTTQGKLDCNFSGEDKFYSHCTLHSLSFDISHSQRECLALYCAGQVIMWAEMLLMEFAVRCT